MKKVTNYKSVFTSLLLIIALISGTFWSAVKAHAEDNSHAALFQTDEDISASSLNMEESFLRKNAETISLLLQGLNLKGITFSPEDEIQVLTKINLYKDVEGVKTLSGSYYPVTKDEKVIALISVNEFQGELKFSIDSNDGFVQLLNEKFGNLASYDFYVEFNGDETAPQYYWQSNHQIGKEPDILFSEQIDPVCTVSDNPVLIPAFFDLSDVANLRALTYTDAYLQSFRVTSCSPMGYNINATLYKTLNISGCFVTQGSYNCAVPCMATIYRYRTSTSVLSNPIIMAMYDQLLNNNYSPSTTAGQIALLTYLLPTAYFNPNSSLSFSRIRQNINNQQPLLFGGHRVDSSGNTYGAAHAFVLYGYCQVSADMYVFVYNPWGDTTVSHSFSDGSDFTFESSDYTWKRTGGSAVAY